MKKILSLIFCFTLFAAINTTVSAQALPPFQPEQDACNALELCGLTFTTPYSYSGPGQLIEHVQFGAVPSCFGETNSVWLKFTVATAGNIVFKIIPFDSTNDYDFAVWDMTNDTCTNVLNSPNQIRCNGNTILPPGSIPAGIIGLNMTSTLTNVAAGTVGDPFLQYIAAVPGQKYLVLVDNFSNSASGFTIDFTGTTATFVQGAHPELASIEPTCSKNEKITVNLSKPVKCNSIAPDGSDFFLTPSGVISSAVGANCSPNGYTTKIQLSFASPLSPGNYVLNAQVGTDGNTLIDLCGNDLLVPDTLHFTVDPANNPNMIRLDTPACSSARIILSHKIQSSTVASNGSDFKVTGPGPVNVIHAFPVSVTTPGLADTIDVYFDGPIKVPGTYTLSVVKGTDGDKISDTCGFSIINTINWVVSDQGYVFASASPDVLCEEGYTNLSATALGNPPLQQLTCGANNTQCNGTPNSFSIGDPNAGNTYNNTPFYGYYKNEHSQMLFTAAQLRAAGLTTGTITSLSLNVLSKNSSGPFKNFTIRMGCTPVDSLSDFVTGTQVVYTPKPYSTTYGINTLPFDVNYDWDGFSNVVVEFCFSNTTYLSADYLQVTTGAAGGSFLFMVDDNTSGCAIGSNTGSYPPSADRPNITFTQCLPPQDVFHQSWTDATFLEDSTAFNTLAYVKSTQAYKIQILDSNRCYRRDTALVTVSIRNPQLVLPTADTAICFGDHAQLLASGGTNYFWYPATGLSCTNCADPVASPQVTTTYYVVFYDQYGCTDTLKRKIVVNPLPVIDMRDDTTIIYGQSVKLNATVTRGQYYLWSPITWLDNPNILVPTATPQVTTIYTLLAIDSNQCKMTDSVKIKVITNIPVNIPSAFTPNGDGKNDEFKVTNLTIQKIVEFRVFNRWGQEVFSTTDNKKGWDGTYQGKPQETDTYSYIIRVASPDGHMDTYKGEVTLIR